MYQSSIYKRTHISTYKNLRLHGESAKAMPPLLSATFSTTLKPRPSVNDATVQGAPVSFRCGDVSMYKSSPRTGTEDFHEDPIRHKWSLGF